VCCFSFASYEGHLSRPNIENGLAIQLPIKNPKTPTEQLLENSMGWSIFRLVPALENRTGTHNNDLAKSEKRVPSSRIVNESYPYN